MAFLYNSLHFSTFLYISLHFSESLCISLHFSESLALHSLHFSSFLYMSLHFSGFIFISPYFSAVLWICLHFSAFHCILHFIFQDNLTECTVVLCTPFLLSSLQIIINFPEEMQWPLSPRPKRGEGKENNDFFENIPIDIFTYF